MEKQSIVYNKKKAVFRKEVHWIFKIKAYLNDGDDMN